MAINFTSEQEAAIKWSFYQENAEWIAGLPNPKQGNHTPAHITSVLDEYRGKAHRDPALLAKIEQQYAAEKQAATLWTEKGNALQENKEVDVIAYSKIKNEAIKWNFEELEKVRIAEEINNKAPFDTQTAGMTRKRTQERFESYEQKLLANPEALAKAIDEYQQRPELSVTDGTIASKIVSKQNAIS